MKKSFLCLMLGSFWLVAACVGASALPTADPPATDDLRGLIGQPAPGWKLDHRFNSEPLALEDLRGKVLLVRWFMAPSCPFCSATAPALNRFDEEYRGRGLVVIGVYHHKEPEPLDVETVRGYIEHYQFRAGRRRTVMPYTPARSPTTSVRGLLRITRP